MHLNGRYAFSCTVIAMRCTLNVVAVNLDQPSSPLKNRFFQFWVLQIQLRNAPCIAAKGQHALIRHCDRMLLISAVQFRPLTAVQRRRIAEFHAFRNRLIFLNRIGYGINLFFRQFLLPIHPLIISQQQQCLMPFYFFWRRMYHLHLQARLRDQRH